MEQHNYNSLPNKCDLRLTLATIIVLTVVSVILFYFSYSKNHVSEHNGVSEIKSAYVFVDNTFSQQISLPESVSVRKKFKYIIDVSDYIHKDNQSIATYFANSNVKVFADNRVIYELNNSKDNAILKGGGYLGVVIDIPNNLRYPYISFEVEPLLPYLTSNTLGEIDIGEKADIIINRFKDDLFLIVMSLMLIINS